MNHEKNVKIVSSSKLGIYSIKILLMMINIMAIVFGLGLAYFIVNQ